MVYTLHNLLYKAWTAGLKTRLLKKEEKLKTKIFKESKCTYVYTANTDKDCDLLHDTTVFLIGRTSHDTQNASLLTTTKIWSRVPKRLSAVTDWLTDWLTGWPSVAKRLRFWSDKLLLVCLYNWLNGMMKCHFKTKLPHPKRVCTIELNDVWWGKRTKQEWKLHIWGLLDRTAG